VVDRPIPDIGKTYDQYAPQIYRYIYHRLGNLPLAEDLTGEVFVRYLRARVTPDNLVAYLYRCAHNIIVDYLRRNPEFLDPLDERVVAEHSDPARIAEVEAERARLRRAISRLTPDQQQVIVLRYVEGFSIQEIARVLDRPDGAVKALQHRAIANLRNLLETKVRREARLEFGAMLER
jgi:RNA polymerase sigma-70 factor (ECF subfamily)